MNREKTDKGEPCVIGTMGEVFPDCYEKVKDDSKRFCCLLKEGSCAHEGLCYIKMQRAIRDVFDKDPKVVAVNLTWSTDTKRYMTRIPRQSMIHSVFIISEDKYTPVEK